MKKEHTHCWTEDLPLAFKDYRAGRRIEEVECIIPDIVGMSRGKAMPFYKFSPEEQFFLPTSLFYQTITGEYVDIESINEQWMEADMVLRPDMSTASGAPWTDDVTMQVICDLEHRDGRPVDLAPRNVLKKIVALYEAKGLRPVVAPEIEFYITKPNLDPNEPIEPPIGRTGRSTTGRQAYSMVAIDDYGPVIDTIYEYAEAQGLGIDTLIQEGGAGQVEINLLHGDPLTLADQVFTFKRAIREAALKNNVFATFMAKPMSEQPGSAMHIHQSVLDVHTGENIFSTAEGEMSAEFYHYLGGSQKHLLEIMPLLTPYENSYRRIISEGMSAPANLEWSLDNRTTGLRIPVSNAANRRIENRTIGIDTNPYLAIAASLAAGYLGLEHKIEPRPQAKGEIWDEGLLLPRSAAEGLVLFEDAKEIRSILGETFCTVYEAIKVSELKEFRQEVSRWEREHLLLNV